MYENRCECAACEYRRQRDEHMREQNADWVQAALMWHLEERNRALTNMDVEYARKIFPEARTTDEVLINAMHKARYECTQICEQLRQESRAWLEERGSKRFGGLAFPSDGGLPK